jgi:hypothetical protein
MLSEARLRPGARVLDLAAGAGDQTKDIALAVGPTGDVLGDRHLTEDPGLRARTHRSGRPGPRALRRRRRNEERSTPNLLSDEMRAANDALPFRRPHTHITFRISKHVFVR